MTNLKQQIDYLARIFHSEVVAIRRHIHANPELAFEEIKTSAFIAKKLKEYGIPFTTNIAKTGIVGFIEGKNKVKVIALRADMDALPIEEANSCSYKSTSTGIMHACGHDAHTAILLGAAKILNELKNQLEGSIKLIFQPSEEAFPGGAKAMIEAGVLENPEVQHVLGLHVLPTLDCGKIAFRSGMFMASTDEIYITVQGKGGHGATPELNVDPVLIASNLVVSLQQIVSRKAPPQIPTVLSFGRFIADGRTNIIPDEARLEGTLRTFNEEWRAKAHILIQDLCKNMTIAMGAICEVRIEKGYPFLVNDQKLTENLKILAREYMGNANVNEMDLRMTAEDFAYFTQIKPSTFFRLGTKTKGKDVTNLHTSTFDIDEEALFDGMGIMAYLSIRQLEEMP